MKRNLILLTLSMLGFGGYIGYTTNYVNTATANEVKPIILNELPRTQGFNLSPPSPLVLNLSQPQDLYQ